MKQLWAFLAIVFIMGAATAIFEPYPLRYNLWARCSDIQNYFGDYSSPSCPFLRGTYRNFSWGFPGPKIEFPGVDFPVGPLKACPKGITWDDQNKGCELARSKSK